MSIRELIYTAVGALTFISTNLRAAGSIRGIVDEVLHRRFSDIELASVIDEMQNLKADKEMFAPLTTGFVCSDARVIRLIESSANGECRRCLRLAFEPTRGTSRYILTTIVFDYDTPSRSEAEAVVETLIRETGALGHLAAAPKATSATFSDSWTLEGEMRSVTASIERRRAGWHVWFTHRRDEVPGVPATRP